VWNLASPQVTLELESGYGELYSVVISSDGKWFFLRAMTLHLGCGVYLPEKPFEF